MGSDPVVLLFLRLSQYFFTGSPTFLYTWSNLRSPVQTGTGARGLCEYFPKRCGCALFCQIVFGNVVHPTQQLN
uniref:Uncharacterized protein n=1 Tax=Anguilla anguilla TaxID=7936 RepID=A0A0E9SUI6_ANGAN